MTQIARSFAGGAADTKLAAPITSGAPTSGGTLSVAAGKGAGYPAANFVIKINPGGTTEEKILMASRAGDVMTVATGGRGYDGTSAADHTVTEDVVHEVDAVVMTAMLEHVNTNAGDDHPMYHNNARGDARYDALGAATAAQAAAVQRANHTGTQPASTISDFTEAAQDATGALIQASADVVPTYDDAGNALTLAVPVKAPTGGIIMWPVAAAPTGWLLCDGSAVSRATYATLFALIGTTYGVGDGATTFNLPNMKGKVAVGVDAAQTEFTPVATTGGEKTHALTTAELASHVHSVDPPSTTSSSDGSHSHTASDGNRLLAEGNADGGGSVNVGNHFVAGTNSAGAHTHSVDIAAFNSAAAGSGTAHNNLQPYLALNFIIKT